MMVPRKKNRGKKAKQVDLCVERLPNYMQYDEEFKVSQEDEDEDETFDQDQSEDEEMTSPSKSSTRTRTYRPENKSR